MVSAFLRGRHDARVDWDYDGIGFTLPQGLWKFHWGDHQEYLWVLSFPLCLWAAQHAHRLESWDKIFDVLGTVGSHSAGLW